MVILGTTVFFVVVVVVVVVVLPRRSHEESCRDGKAVEEKSNRGKGKLSLFFAYFDLLSVVCSLGFSRCGKK